MTQRIPPDLELKAERHPLAIELLVNCAACGNILNAEQCCRFEESKPFSKQILITVERCVCDTAADF